MTVIEFLNHIRATLDGSLQRWKFGGTLTHVRSPFFSIGVCFVGTGRCVEIAYDRDQHTWHVSGDDLIRDRIESLLSGCVRDDEGEMVQP